MPLSTSQPEVIEIPDSPTAQSEAIVISDDEVTELLDYRAKQIYSPRIPSIQPPAYEPEGDGSQESMNLALVYVKSSSDGLMASPGRVVSFQSSSSGHGYSGGYSCLDALDRELGEISQEIENDGSSVMAQIFQDFESQVLPRTTGIADHKHSPASKSFIEPSRQGEASAHGNVHHTTKKTGPPEFLQGKSVQTSVGAVPKYNHYIEIERSFLANETRLPPEPSASQVNKSTPKEEMEAAILKSTLLCAKLAKESRKRETLVRIGPYLPQIRLAYQHCKNRLEEEGLSEFLDVKDPEHPSYHVKKAFGMRLGSYLGLEISTTNLQKSVTTSSDPLGKTLEGYARESCLICSAHRCYAHGKFVENGGEDDSGVNDTTDDETPSDGTGAMYQLYSMPHTRMRTYYNRENSTGNESEGDSDCGERKRPYYCSAACRLNPSNEEFDKEGEWTEEIHALLQIQVESMGIRKNQRASCLIAGILDKPCSEVHRRLQKLGNQRVELDMVTGNDKRSKKFDWRDLDGEHKHDMRLQPRPCYHPGKNCFVAGKECTCVSNGICCDKFCTCPQSCNARYPGCTCSGPCILQKCTCYQSNRECDPDLCHKCRVVESVRSHGSIPDTNCHNCEIQRAQGKKVLVGESSIEGIGNGLYLAEPAQEGDFIAEYVGEIISEAEAKRREDLKSRMGMSYNFALNAEMTIDAMWFGNATRFINHSEVRNNCRAKVMLVNSEHRIGFYASKKIDAGEELFFNYGKEFKLIEKLKEAVISPSARKKTSSKQHRTEPMESTIKNTKAIMGDGVDEDDDPEEDFGDWLARTRRKRASDDDDDYIERRSHQGTKRARSSLRNRRGR